MPPRQSKASKAKSHDDGEKKRKRAKKDPNAPKRAITAFIVFANKTRAQLRAENPSMKITEIAALMGRMWKEMTDEDKQEYNDEAAADKERYQREMEDYSGSAAAESKPSKRTKVQAVVEPEDEDDAEEEEA